MAFGREDAEFVRPDALPDWMRRFAECELASEAAGKGPFQEIRDILDGKSKGKGAIEEKLAEMRARMGLDKLSEDDPEGSIVSTASLRCGSPAKKEFIAELAEMAIRLEASGNPAAVAANNMLVRLLKEAEEIPESLKENPNLKTFIDNVCRTRGGHVSVPAVLKMVRDERPENVALDGALRAYVEQRLSGDKQEVSDGSASVAGAGVGMMVSREEEEESNKLL